MQGESEMVDNWKVRNEEFTASDLQLAINDGLPKSVRDELDEHPEDYCSLTYEDWCDLLSTIKVKDERKRASVHINNIDSARAAYLSDSNDPARILKKKKAKTGLFHSNKSSKNLHRHHRIHRYCVLYKKAGMPKRKYTSHNDEDCNVMCTNRSIKYGMRGPVGSRADDVQQYTKSKKNGRRS